MNAFSVFCWYWTMAPGGGWCRASLEERYWIPRRTDKQLSSKVQRTWSQPGSRLGSRRVTVHASHGRLETVSDKQLKKRWQK